jgi:hypothetical protein
MKARGCVLVGCVLAFSTPALADAIDGNWCSPPPDNRRVTILGPTILTPGGQRAEGAYDRHHFSYKVPAGEIGAGGAVNMVLINDYAVRVLAEGNAEQVWRRCSAPVS